MSLDDVLLLSRAADEPRCAGSSSDAGSPHAQQPRFTWASTEEVAIDKNFAVHLPWIDKLFGTYYGPPGEWPREYGIAGIRFLTVTSRSSNGLSLRALHQSRQIL